MAVKEGYKLTEVGVIPEDWLLAKLSDLTTIIGDGIHATPDYIDSSGYYFINGNNLSDGDIVFFDGTKQVSLEEYTKYMKNLNDRTILMSINGTIGNLAYYNNEVVILGKSVCYINIEKATNEDFIYYQLQSKYVGNFYDNELTGSTIKNLSLNSVRNTPIVLPKSQEEQKAIATALSDIDDLINSLIKLIEKKKNIKQGAMQELFTGKKRLDGFSGEWEKKAIKQIVHIPVSDGPHLTPKFSEDGIPFLSVNNLVNNKISFDGVRYISKQDHIEFSKKCKPENGDILLGKAASVGMVAIAKLNCEFNIWSPIAVIRLKEKYDASFFLYSFQTEKVVNNIKFLTNSSSQGNLGMSDIERIEFLIPTKEEQTAIATILSDMDSEIESLQTKLDKYKAIKQGMMKELLTGRIRLLEGA